MILSLLFLVGCFTYKPVLPQGHMLKCKVIDKTMKLDDPMPWKVLVTDGRRAVIVTVDPQTYKLLQRGDSLQLLIVGYSAYMDNPK